MPVTPGSEIFAIRTTQPSMRPRVDRSQVPTLVREAVFVELRSGRLSYAISALRSVDAQHRKRTRDGLDLPYTVESGS